MSSHEERFHQNVLGFAALLIELNDLCHKRGYGVIDQGILRVAEAAIKNFSPETVIGSFCKHSRPLWDKIKQRDEESLKKSLSVIFANLPVDLSSQIVELVEKKDSNGNRIVPKEDLEAIWLYLDALIKIGIKWLYQKQPLPELEMEASKWGIRLH
jgi:hypothetical protein